MTELLDRAVANIHALPAAAQDDVARKLLQWIGEEQAPVQLTAEEDASFKESLAQADRGECASEAEVRVTWARHDPEAGIVATAPARIHR